MHSDHACQKSMKMFQTFKDKRPNTALNDRVYLSTYVEQIIDQLSLKEAQNEATQKRTGRCPHAGAKFNQGSQGIDMDRAQQTKAESGGGGAAGGPQLSTTAAATQQANFQVFRLMWSKKSQIMAIHYLNLNPYQIQTQGYKNYRKIMSENYELLQQSTVGALPSADSASAQPCGCKVNQIGDKSQPPIFLRRNLKQMMKFRERQSIASNSMVSNGLSQRILPHINSIAYEPCNIGEDTFHYRKSGLVNVEKGHIRQDIENQLRSHNIRSKRLKTLLEK